MPQVQKACSTCVTLPYVSHTSYARTKTIGLQHTDFILITLSPPCTPKHALPLYVQRSPSETGFSSTLFPITTNQSERITRIITPSFLRRGKRIYWTRQDNGTITGDSSGNNLIGTADDDDIYGLLGDDTLRGYEAMTPFMAIQARQKSRHWLLPAMVVTH